MRTRQMELLGLGPRWGVLRSARFGAGEAVCEIYLPNACLRDLDTYRFHPAMVDVAIGFALPLIEGYEESRSLYVPMSYKRVSIFRRLPQHVYSHVVSEPTNHADRETAVFHATITDDQGDMLAQVEGFTVRRVSEASMFGSEAGGAGRDAQLTEGEQMFLETFEAGITADEGMGVIDRVLSLQDAPRRIVASSIDLKVLMDRNNALHNVREEASVKFARPNLSSTFELPRNGLEKRLAASWEELLGVENIGIHDDFFELGGHSLIAVRLFARIKKTWGVDLPISVLFEAPAIAGCADLLRAEVGDADVDAEGDQPLPTRPARNRYVVPMNRVAAEQRPPFFLVAGMFGNVLNLRHLAAHLGDDQPVYAIQARGLHGDDRPHTRFEDMARDYLEELRSIQPHGPYFLGGFSGGGITAFEMAHQLSRGGETVGVLVMLDTSPPPKDVPQLTMTDRLLIQAYRLRRGGVRYAMDWAKNRWNWEMRRFRKEPLVELTPAEFRSGEIQAGFVESAVTL